MKGLRERRIVVLPSAIAHTYTKHRSVSALLVTVAARRILDEALIRQTGLFCVEKLLALMEIELLRFLRYAGLIKFDRVNPSSLTRR